MNQSNGILIRRYREGDFSRIREICCETAFSSGPSVDFPDRDIFADYWTRYYTACEPAGIWVVESQTNIVGYILGSTNSFSYGAFRKFILFPLIVWKIITRGHLTKTKLLSLALACLFSKKPDETKIIIPPSRNSSHLHINLLPTIQGKGLGKALLEKFENYSINQKVTHITAEVREDNQTACRFFEKNGFVVQEMRIGYRVREQQFNVLVFVKNL